MGWTLEDSANNYPWRVGRKLGRTIYAQLGEEPSADDPFLGLMESEDIAVTVVQRRQLHEDDRGPRMTHLQVPTDALVVFEDMRLSQGECAWVLERIETRTEVIGDCWVWTGYRKNGYGAISVRNRMRYVHRLSLAIATGTELGAEMDVCHTCDNPPCWRPLHLFEGTRLDNIEDAYSKGRGSLPPRVTGERHAKAVLTDDEVDALRSAWADEDRSQHDLAAAFGVSQSTVWRIVHRHTRSGSR